MFLSPARGRGKERGNRCTSPSLPASPPNGGEEKDRRGGRRRAYRLGVSYF
jgi:hypothetical protein